MFSILDAYSGAGGFSLGAHRAGFRTALAIDADELLSSSFRHNFRNSELLCQDIRTVDASTIGSKLPKGVDGVIGGPPCQAFSEIGRRDHRDPRRLLVQEFFRIVALAKPKFFVFENVPGLGFKENIDLLERGLELLPANWAIIGPHTLNAADFGAPTRRFRLFVFGFDKNQVDPPSEGALIESPNVSVYVRDAIADLSSAAESGVDEFGFDFWRYDQRRTVSAYASKMRTKSGLFTGHRKTIHNRSTLARFKKLSEGEFDKIGRYARLSWNGLCPTLRAGTGSDRGSYQAVRPIHPTLNRVITPREAARLQGFPDWFEFHPTIWHSCRMIGNSVSPIIAEALLKRIAASLDSKEINAVAAE